jgi:hypothetical protein
MVFGAIIGTSLASSLSPLKKPLLLLLLLSSCSCCRRNHRRCPSPPLPPFGTLFLPPLRLPCIAMPLLLLPLHPCPFFFHPFLLPPLSVFPPLSLCFPVKLCSLLTLSSSFLYLSACLPCLLRLLLRPPVLSSPPSDFCSLLPHGLGRMRNRSPALSYTPSARHF